MAPAQDRAGFRAVLDQPAGFQRLQPGDRRSVQNLAFRHHVDHLAARHAARARRGPKRHDQFAAGLRVGMGIVFAQHLERTALQRVAGQDRGRLVKRLMCAGFAAPQVVVVHRRQIVMHQRIGVHHLHRGRNPGGAGLVDAEERGSFP